MPTAQCSIAGMRLVLAIFLSACCASCGGRPEIAGNDQGGLINWSPAAELASEAIAWDHCSQYGRAAYVTRINRRPGDYIAFRCLTYPVDRVTSSPDFSPVPPAK